MIGPLLHDAVLADTSLSAADASALKPENAIENNGLENPFAAVLQLPQDPGAGADADEAGGRLLPLALPTGMMTPPGVLQSLDPLATGTAGQAIAMALQPVLLTPAQTHRLSLPALLNGPDTASGQVPILHLDGMDDMKMSDFFKTAVLSVSEREAGQGPLKKVMDESALRHMLAVTEAARDNATPQAVNTVRDSAPAGQVLQPLPSISTQARADAAPQVMTLQTPVFKPGWQEAFNSNIMLLVREQAQTARLNVNPPDLGPIEIRLSVQNDQASIQFFSQHGVIRDVIEDAFPRLREMLASNGIDLGDVNVSKHPDSQHTPGGPEAYPADPGEPPADFAEPVPTRQIRLRGLVDHYI